MKPRPKGEESGGAVGAIRRKVCNVARDVDFYPPYASEKINRYIAPIFLPPPSRADQEQYRTDRGKDNWRALKNAPLVIARRPKADKAIP
jgi:hypothetical protein